MAPSLFQHLAMLWTTSCLSTLEEGVQPKDAHVPMEMVTSRRAVTWDSVLLRTGFQMAKAACGGRKVHNAYGRILT